MIACVVRKKSNVPSMIAKINSSNKFCFVKKTFFPPPDFNFGLTWLKDKGSETICNEFFSTQFVINFFQHAEHFRQQSNN